MKIKEINSPGELGIDNDLIDRFTDRGWEILGEGRDQIVLGKPGSRMLLKIVGFGSLTRQATIRKYITFFRAHQRNPHFPRVGVDRTLKWKGRHYYAYTQERLQHMSGDEAVLDYLEDVMGRITRDESPDYDKIPAGLTEEQVDGLVMAIETMFQGGLGTDSLDLGNIYNLMQREDGQLVIVDPYSSWDDEDLEENFDDGKKPGRKGLAKRMGVNCKQPVSKLRKIARNSSGERARMAHWCANMKSGRQKSA